jgi:hypothetical protein
MGIIKECLTGTDASHKISSMRVSVMVTVFTIMGTFVAHNVMAMIVGRGFVSLGWNEVVILSAVLGAKALQHKSETNQSPVSMTASISNGGTSTVNDDADLSKPD